MHTYNTKYALGDEVYLFDKDTKTGELYTVRAKIEEILISKDYVKYYLDGIYEEISEEDIILANTRKPKISHNANNIAKEYGRYQKWYDKQKQKWRVRFVSNDETSYLGTFLTEKDAENAINQHNEILMKGEEK